MRTGYSYGSMTDMYGYPQNREKDTAESRSNACGHRIVYILLLLFVISVAIALTVYPMKTHSTSNIQDAVDATSCATHICFFSMDEVDIESPAVELFEKHASTIPGSSRFAFVDIDKFEESAHVLTMTLSEGTIISMPLIAYNEIGVYFYETADLDHRFLININFESNAIEGFATENGRKYELHSIGEAPFYLLIEKKWIGDAINWCGIFDISTKYNPMQNEMSPIEGSKTEGTVLWMLNGQNMVSSHFGLDGLHIMKQMEQGFHVQPLCSDLSPFDANVYCLYPNTNSWQGFDELMYYQFDGVEWKNVFESALNMSTNTPKSITVADNNEIYAFSVNAVDKMVNIYSFTDAWRLHHFMPMIGGDVEKFEMSSIYVADTLYFTLNEYGMDGNFSLYQYEKDLIFSEVYTWQKVEVPVYSHCLTEFDDQLLIFYVDFDFHLYAFYDGVQYDMDFVIENEISTNHFDCTYTQNGNIISWKYKMMIYLIQLSITDFKDITNNSTLAWNGETNNNFFQLIQMRNIQSEYKSVSVYYTDDILDNYMPNVESLSMDISSIITFSNILYALNDDCNNMMKLSANGISLYGSRIDSFMSYEGQSNLNILLVDAMQDEDEIGISECDASDQSFAVVEFTVF